jgi:hypothetical protein
MGVMHFAGLGKSPGAVTAGLAYIKHEFGPHFEEGDIVESVVIFTSPEITSGAEPAYESVHNEYMQRSVRKTWTQGMRNSLEIVAKYLYREIEEGPFYVCEIDVNDFSACFDAVAKAVLKFHPPGKVGKHIWANITGGSNVLNAALMQTAYLSGFISRLYYTFVANLKEDGKYLQPFSRNEAEFDYREIYVLKTTFDERYRYILEELERIDQETPGRWVSSGELLSRLKGSQALGFEGMSLNAFRRDFLNTMSGVERRGNRIEGQEDANRIGEDGRATLAVIRSPLFKALTRQERLLPEDIEALTKDLNIRKLPEL